MVDSTESGNRVENHIKLFIIYLIILNVIAVILETCKSIYQPYAKLFYLFEVFSVVVFTIEYLLRLWVITENPDFSHPVKGRIKYIFTPLAIIDLIAILPFYLPFMNIDFRFIRSIRLTRLFRIAKLGRYSVALEAMNIAIKRKKEQLIITVGILLFFLLLSSSLLYYTEYEAQPDKFTSIPHAMWWGIATLTTVGYGDIYPVTTAGKIISSLIAIIGVGICALPTGIISAGFLENIRNNQESTKVCPHCGKEII